MVVCVSAGRARALVGTRAASSVAFVVAAPALAVVPRRSWRCWSSCCPGSMGRARLGLLDDQLLRQGMQGDTPCGSNCLGRPASM
jgi:hypothetical protein